MELRLGSVRERRLADAENFLIAFREDIGYQYYAYVPTTSPDVLLPEDLAVTLALNSQAQGKAFVSLMQHSGHLDLSVLPPKGLEATTSAERKAVARLVAQVAQWPGFGSSLATKVIHKKRPSLIPVLDNQAIFGAYMSANWPEVKASTETVKSEPVILAALESIAHDISRSDNAAAWAALRKIEPERTTIELFDMVWWIYFRRTQPVPARSG